MGGLTGLGPGLWSRLPVRVCRRGQSKQEIALGRHITKSKGQRPPRRRVETRAEFSTHWGDLPMHLELHHLARDYIGRREFERVRVVHGNYHQIFSQGLISCNVERSEPQQFHVILKAPVPLEYNSAGSVLNLLGN